MAKEEKIFILNDIMMPLFMAKEMVEFVNKRSLTIAKKTIENLTKEELEQGRTAVQISFACKKRTDAREIVKEIRRLSKKHDILMYI